MQEQELDLFDFTEQGEQEIVSYSKLLERQKSVRDEIANLIELINNRSNNDLEKSAHSEISSKVNEMLVLTDKLVKFFKDPPSDDELLAINRAANIQKAIKHFKDFSDNLEKLNLKEQSENFANEFDNFVNTTGAKLEAIATRYDEFLNNFVKRQQESVLPISESIKDIDDKLRGVVSHYDKSFVKLLKTAKYSLASIFTLNILMALVLGGFSIGAYFKSKHLDEILDTVNAIKNIKFYKDDKHLVLEIPKDKVKITQNGNEHKISILN